MTYKECENYDKGECMYHGGSERCVVMQTKDWDECPISVDYYDPYFNGDTEEF